MAIVLTLLAGPGIVLVSGKVPLGDNWWSGSREPAGLAPNPETFRDAIVQVYAARAWGWRGAFGVHTWVAVKPENADSYTLLEIASDMAGDGSITREILSEVLVGGALRRFDKGGDVFYDQISALHKSVRGSNPDAALYWFCRMIDGGCDPIYIARRVVRIASEDIGNADPRALQIALDAWQVQERLGSPEGELAIAQAITYLSIAAKSNAVYKAFNRAMDTARESGSLEVPLHLRNAPTRLMKDLGHGRDYRYAHDEPDAYAAGESYLPDALGPVEFYEPVDRGMESRIREKLEWIRHKDRDSG